TTSNASAPFNACSISLAEKPNAGPAKAARRSYGVCPGRLGKKAGPSEKSRTQSSARQRGHCAWPSGPEPGAASAARHAGQRLHAPVIGIATHPVESCVELVIRHSTPKAASSQAKGSRREPPEPDPWSEWFRAQSPLHERVIDHTPIARSPRALAI